SPRPRLVPRPLPARTPGERPALSPPLRPPRTAHGSSHSGRGGAARTKQPFLKKIFKNPLTSRTTSCYNTPLSAANGRDRSKHRFDQANMRFDLSHNRNSEPKGVLRFPQGRTWIRVAAEGGALIS